MKRALVTGGTYDDVAPIATFIINVARTNSHLFDEIVVYHNGIKKKDQNIINSIFKTRFIEYTYNPKNQNDEIALYFSAMVFCKYECFKLLAEYDEVVWSDYDVVIRGKLDDFCIIKEARFNILTCDDNLRSMFYKDIDLGRYSRYDLETDGVGTPLFALSNKLDKYQEIYDWCYQKTGDWCEDLYLPEQCIFSLAVQEFGIVLERFPFDKYACYPTRAKGDELIVHAAGQPKFWNGLEDKTWNDMYSEWLGLGGSRYSEIAKRVKRKYLFLLSRIKGKRGREHG